MTPMEDTTTSSYKQQSLAGWWFRTMEFYDFPYIILGRIIIPTDFHSIIFQRGRAQPPTRLDSLHPRETNGETSPNRGLHAMLCPGLCPSLSRRALVSNTNRLGSLTHVAARPGAARAAWRISDRPVGP